jgi:hypothetical protein
MPALLQSALAYSPRLDAIEACVRPPHTCFSARSEVLPVSAERYFADSGQLGRNPSSSTFSILAQIVDEKLRPL